MHNQEYYFNLLYTNSAKIQLTFQILPIIVGIWQRKYLNKPLRIFLTFYCCAFLANTLELLFVWAVDNYTSFWLPYIQYWKIDSTNFIAIINYLANFGIMGWYFTLVFKSQTLSNGIKILSFILFLSALINYMFIEGYNVFGIFNPLMDALYSIFIPLIFMWILYNQLESKVPITKNSYFWVNLRFIVPNLIGLFLFFAGDKIYKTDFVLFVKISIVKTLFFIIGHLFAVLAFYYARYTKYLPQKTTAPLAPQ